MIPQITVQQLAAKLAAGEPVYLLDVRQPDEHAYAALPDSTLIPLGELPGRIERNRPAGRGTGRGLLPPRRPQPDRGIFLAAGGRRPGGVVGRRH